MVLIYLITNSPKEAKEIGKELLEARLANSVNIIPNIQTMRWHNGSVKEESDHLVLIKTKALLYSKIEALICDFMKKENPAIFSMPITQINHPYRDALREGTIAV